MALPVDLRALLPQVRASVREAALLALPFFRAGERTTARVWSKSGGSPVTEADVAVDTFLKIRLSELAPKAAWLSEETRDDPVRLEHDLVWIVDPIDGTRAFLRRLPEFAVSVALVEDGRPIAGAVANPATGEHFEATVQGGAGSGTPLRLSGGADIATARLLASRRTLEAAAGPLPDTQFFSVHSIAYRLALVATGRYDAAVAMSPKSDWDIAAAEVLVLAAGGVVTDIRGEALVYNREQVRHLGIVAAGPALHAELVARLRQRA